MALRSHPAARLAQKPLFYVAQKQLILLDSLLQEIVENEGKVAQEEGSQAEEEKEEDEAEVKVNFRPDPSTSGHAGCSSGQPRTSSGDATSGFQLTGHHNRPSLL